AARGDFAGAVADYGLALRLEPDAATHLRRGQLYLDAGAARLALADFDACLRLDADSAEGHVGRAAANLQAGLFREAIRDAQRARKLAPGPNPELVSHQAAVVLAQAPARIEADKTLSRREKDRLVGDCTEDALNALRDALLKTRADQRSTFWRERVRLNPAFDRLRSHDRYRGLERDLAGLP